MSPPDAFGPYLRWMNDPEVTAQLESRFRAWTGKELEQYILDIQQSKSHVFCAIVLNEGDRHIGNIKIGPIHPFHLSGDIGIIIGEKDCWGQGYAAEAIGLLSDYAFQELGLHKITAGAYSENKGSVQAFLKCGFAIEGIRKGAYRLGDQWVDGVLMGMLNPAPPPIRPLSVDLEPSVSES